MLLRRSKIYYMVNTITNNAVQIHPAGQRKEVTSMTNSLASRSSFYSVCHKVNGDWQYVRAFAVIKNARKMAKLLAKNDWCEEVAIFRGKPGEYRIAL